MKLGIEINRHPKLGHVGTDGLAMFVEFLGSCIRHDRDGVVPRRFSTVDYLRGMLFQYGWTTKRVAKVRDSLVDAGLIEPLDGGGYFVTGWDDYWKPPMTPKERKARERAKRREELGLDPQQGEAETGQGHAGDVTGSRATRDNVTPGVTSKKVGREERKKVGREGGSEGGPEEASELDREAGLPKTLIRAADLEARELAGRDSHPLGLGGYRNARLACAWHRRIRSGDATIQDVPACFLDYLIDPETRQLLAQPLDPAHEPAKLAAIAQRNRAEAPLFHRPKESA